MNATNFPRSNSPDAYAFAFVADSFDDDIKPVPPLKAGNNMQNPSPTTIIPNPPSPTISVVSAISDDLYRPPSIYADARMSTLTTESISFDPPSRRVSIDTRPSFEAGDDGTVITPTRTKPPASRFSWTTQATESPPRNAYPTPSPGSSQIGSSPPQPLIMRKRPMSIMSTSSVVRRKPTPSQILATQVLSGQQAPKPVEQAKPKERPQSMVNPPRILNRKDVPVPIIKMPVPPKTTTLNVVRREPVIVEEASTSKDLPLSPPELESVDLVTELQAQIDDMAHRRRNLQKVIQSLTALQPQNPVIQDLTARREAARKVSVFKAQLAEVQQREYDLGVRLCRAWKRRDQEAPTTLWVRRVTT